MENRVIRKFRATIVVMIPYEMEWFPHCKTLKEAAALQQEWLNDGTMDVGDLFSGDSDISIRIEPE